MSHITVTVDYVPFDNQPAAPLWTAESSDDPDPLCPLDVWCLMWRGGSSARLRSVRTLKDFFCETSLVGDEFDWAVSCFMAETLGCLASAYALSPVPERSQQDAA